jgi:hypothetical protein
LTHHIAVQTAF